MTLALTEKQKHDICTAALEAKKDIEVRYLEFGSMLHKIKEERCYEAGWSSWEEFAMELKLSQASISRIVRIYQIFVLRFKFAPAQLAQAGGWTVVAEYLPDIDEKTTKEQVKEMLHTATHQTRTDLRRTITEKRTGKDMTKCKHPDAYTLRVCPHCHLKEKV